jgi:methionyl aminopeptidase
MIILKSPEEIERLRVSNRIVAEALARVVEAVRPGVSTEELDQLAVGLIRQAGAIPAFKGYRGYPRTLCTSINEEVVHGIPSPTRRLREGDILSIDVGVRHEGYYGDTAVTVGVGEIGPEARRLLEVTQEALRRGIACARASHHLFDISSAIQRCVEEAGFSVVRKFVGHGIGASLHEEPQVPNFGEPGQGPRLSPGMVLAIEPMVNVGGSEVETLSDHWTVVTSDGSLSAHFEHTILITEEGAEILSRPDGTLEGVYGERAGH